MYSVSARKPELSAEVSTAFEHGRVNSVTLGDFVVKNVPVHLLDTRRFAAVTGGKRVDGILGTVVLYHFLATLDYPAAKLILKKRPKVRLDQASETASAEKNTVIPFWMAGDHLIVAWGTVNKSKQQLFFVDTGLAGNGFTCPESTVKEAGIKVNEGLAAEGIGGGGKMRVVPFVTETLALGDASAQGIRGVFGPFPPNLEYGQGFRIGGLISHQFFRPYTVTFDFATMRLYLQKPSPH